MAANRPATTTAERRPNRKRHHLRQDSGHFDTIEHEFLFRTELFGFGKHFIKVICIFYKDINSYVLLNLNISKRFSINRSVRQGCPISPFLFILVVELLSLDILNNAHLYGLTIFNK